MAEESLIIGIRPETSRGARTITRDMDQIKRRARDVERGTDKLGRTSKRSFNEMARGSRQATQGVNGMAAAMRKAQNIMLAFFSVAAARSFTNSISRALDEMDGLAKAADRLGVGIEPLQELRFAAEQSGIAINSFDIALQRFTRRTAEAARGTGEARDALNELGIQLTNSQGILRPVEELLFDTADALAELESQGERVRLGFKLFDSEGLKVIQMLQEGSAHLRQMRGEARELGIVLGEDLVRDAERMKTEMGRQFAALDSLWSKFVVNFLRGADRIFSFIPKTGAEQLAARVNELQTVQDRIATLSQRGGVMFGPGDTGGTAERLGALREREAQLLSEVRTLHELAEAQERVSKALAAAENAGGLGPVGGAVTPRTEGVSRLTEAMERAKTTAEELRDTGAEAMRGISDAADRAAEHTRLAWRNMTGGFVRDLQSGLDQGKGMWRSFADAALNTINRITDALLNQLLDAIFKVNNAGGGGGILGTILGGLLGAGSAGTIAPSGASFLGGGVGRVPIGFQHGGSFTVGGAGGADRNLVAFRATRGERVDITPAGQSREREGGGNVYNIDARGADPAGLARVERLIMDLSNENRIRRIAVDGVADAKQRGHPVLRGRS